MIILDRFEKDIAVLEKNGKFIYVNKNKISPIAKEGDVLVLKNGIYSVDMTLTLLRKQEIEKKFRSLWK